MIMNEEDNIEEIKEIEEMLFDMSTDEFIENEIETQMNEEIFIDSEKKRNYVELYIEKFKYLKTIYVDDPDTLEELEENKNSFIENIINSISSKFNFEVDEEAMSKKMAKTLYNFFIIDYTDNLKEFFLNFLQKNKKSIILELKANKSKVRDISTIASKIKYFNINDALIINNINSVLLNIIPSIVDESFLTYILDYDDSITNKNIKKLINKEDITISKETFDAYLEPFVDEWDGYTSIITDIILELSKQIKQNDINIFE